MKNIIYSFLLISLSLFIFSCSSEEDSKVPESRSLEEIHMQTKKQLSELFLELGSELRGAPSCSDYGVFNRDHFNHIEMNFQENYSEDYESVMKEFDENRDIVKRYDVSFLLEKNGLNPKIEEYLEFFINNEGTENVYDLFLSTYGIISNEDASLVFLALESYKIIGSNSSLRASMSAGCAIALAGTVATTLGAATVTTGFGLGVFLVGKALSIVSLGLSCP